jgi:hypothetical protein
MRQAVIIRTTGLTELVNLDEAKDQLKFMQEVVGGWIEAVDVQDNMTLWCNEEGKLMGLDPNYVAVSKTSAHEVLMPGDIIAGDVIITGGTGSDGETLGLTTEQVAVLLDKAGAVN